MSRRQMFLHCCHCSWCQRETGGSFAWNTLIEAEEIKVLKGKIETINTPSSSGQGQKIVRCASCQTALWSNYGAAGDEVHFVRVGTLDNPDLFPSDIHIFASSKQGCLQFAESVPVVRKFYRRSDY